VSDKLEEYRQKVVGTNIDPRSLLSTDYFNTFNSVVMIFDMLPEMPELMEEVEQWQFYNYAEHFQNSGLDFAQLAIEAYEYSPPELKKQFDRKVNAMRIFIEEAIHTLKRLREAEEMSTFGKFARQTAELFRGMMDEGSAIVHGQEASMNQDNIDKFF
jgi:hypothetical protein